MDRGDYITATGISVVPGDPPDPFQVKHCEAWIRRFARPQKSINHSITSYSLKHVAENWSYEGIVWPDIRGYCTNGTFIRAAVNLGYRYLPAGSGKNPNVYFNMHFLKIRRSRHQILDYRFSFLPWDDEPAEETYILEYSASHHVRGLFPFHVSTKKKSDRRGPGPGCWKVIASGSESEMFAMLEAKAKEMGVE